jgi:uncharacterized lipoprotein YmbA
MRLPLTSAVAMALAILAGCASQKADFYTLSPEAPPETNRSAMSTAVVVGPVVVPELIDRPQIVVSTGANQVHIDEFARWAEPLKSQIPRVVAADLARLLNTAHVSASQASGDPDPAYRVRIDVQRFDAILGKAVTVDALWSVTPPGRGTPETGRTTVSEPCAGEGYDVQVAAYSRALATVSGDIATRMGSNSISQKTHTDP